MITRFISPEGKEILSVGPEHACHRPHVGDLIMVADGNEKEYAEWIVTKVAFFVRRGILNRADGAELYVDVFRSPEDLKS